MIWSCVMAMRWLYFHRSLAAEVTLRERNGAMRCVTKNDPVSERHRLGKSRQC